MQSFFLGGKSKKNIYSQLYPKLESFIVIINNLINNFYKLVNVINIFIT